MNVTLSPDVLRVGTDGLPVGVTELLGAPAVRVLVGVGLAVNQGAHFPQLLDDRFVGVKTYCPAKNLTSAVNLPWSSTGE
jgi:hypothetical protein